MDSVREGQVLAGKYRVERVLGQGGMGVVVAAMHQQLEQRVALKFLLPEVEDQDTRARFLREAKAAVRLKSEHVARVLDVGTLDVGSPYIVMEFLEGRDLAALLEEQGKLPLDAAVEYTLQACEAIAEAHAAGIVHRDLKPANLFLTRRNDSSPCVKVLDFGISKMATPESPHGVTQNAAMLGTPQYMSPEQLRSSRDVDMRSDIWAMGMILYELLTGAVAFHAETLPELCAAILTREPTPLLDLAPHLPPAIDAIVRRALEKDPARRYPTLAAFALDLAPFWSGGHVAARKIAQILENVPLPPTTPGLALPSAGRPSSDADATLSVPPPTPPAASSTSPSAETPSWIVAPATHKAPLPDASPSPPRWTSPVRVTLGVAALLAVLGGLHLAQKPPAAPASALPRGEPSLAPTAAPTASVAASATGSAPSAPPPAAPALATSAAPRPQPPARKPASPSPAPPRKPSLTSDFGSRK
jgi:serine/threonine-protein kinase